MNTIIHNTLRPPTLYGFRSHTGTGRIELRHLIPEIWQAERCDHGGAV